MPLNKIQFQQAMSLPDFLGRFGSEEQCIQALFACRWPSGFSCPRCKSVAYYRVETAGRPLFQYRTCRHQASLTVGTLLESSKLPFEYLVSGDLHHQPGQDRHLGSMSFRVEPNNLNGGRPG